MVRVSDLLPAERPRERCLEHGAECLSLRECLALVLGSGPRGLGSLGLAARLLDSVLTEGGSDEQEHAFFRAFEDPVQTTLWAVEGSFPLRLGPASRARLLAAIELARRFHRFRAEPDTRQSIDPSDRRAHAVREIPSELRASSREWLGFVPCRAGGRVGSFCLVDRGTRTHVNTDPAELFRNVLATRPTGFYLFHNHPSGSLTPSEEDRHLTREVSRVARDLGTPLLGHGIVTTTSDAWIVL